MNIGFLLLFFTVKGGSERAAATLTAGLAERGHHCTLFHPYQKGLSDAYVVPDKVARVELPALPVTDKWLDQAGVQLHAAHLHVLCLMSSGSYARIFPSLCRGLHVPLVWSERNAPDIIETERWNRAERLACMAGADAVHLLCRDFLSSLPPRLRKRATVIPNFSSLPPAETCPSTHRQYKRLLTLARLHEPAKQLSVLLHAFALLKDDFPDWECRICGEGTSRKSYEMFLAKSHLNDKIILPGEIEDVSREYATADLFVLPSRYEGFPNALAEAQSFGLPSVGFAACPGVNEIIVHGENGLLAPEMTAESLAEHLHILMADEQLRQRMGARARELSARYKREHILDQWERLLQHVAETPRPMALDVVDSMKNAEIRNGLQSLRAKSTDVATTTTLLTTLRSQARRHMMHTSLRRV